MFQSLHPQPTPPAPTLIVILYLLPQDPELRAAANILQQGLNATTAQEEEAAWTKIIEAYQGRDAPWAADVVGRALGNRGNVRARQVRGSGIVFVLVLPLASSDHQIGRLPHPPFTLLLTAI